MTIRNEIPDKFIGIKTHRTVRNLIGDIPWEYLRWQNSMKINHRIDDKYYMSDIVLYFQSTHRDSYRIRFISSFANTYVYFIFLAQSIEPTGK